MVVQHRTLEAFTQDLALHLKDAMQTEFNESVTTVPRTVLKTNVEKTGITVHFNSSNISPTLYVEDAFNDYLNGESIPDIAKKMALAAQNARDDAPKLTEFSVEEAKKHVFLVVINTSMNEELLKKVPHIEILGGELSAVPRWIINDSASFLVTNELASHLMLTPEEVIRIGQDNVNSHSFEVRSMQEILSELTGTEVPDIGGPEIFVLTTANKLHGSSVLLSKDTLDRVHDILGDFILLPSSTHEVIALSYTKDMDPLAFSEMIRAVNSTEVSLEDRLADKPFVYNGQRLEIFTESFKFATEDNTLAVSNPQVHFSF